MNTRYTTVNLDVSQQGSIPSITLSQYDLGVGLSFYIMDGGLPYSAFAETDTVVLSGTKPSGVGFTIPAYYKSENLCSFRTTQAMTTEAGTVTCEITITKVNNISVSTANFYVEVEASAHAHETVDEDIEDFSLIANQVGEYKAVAVRAAQQAAQSATDAAASASSAEESMEAAQSAASSAIAAKDDIQEYIDDSEAWAKGTRGGIEVPSTDETYHNNAKYYAEQSSQASMDAGSSASEAAASAQEAAASVVGAVKYTAQSLTDAQKTQARTNIGAASPSDIPSGTVRYDTSQNLTDAQKTQAKNNIGVPVIDATLAVTGAAADAKKVGDEIADLKGDLSESFYDTSLWELGGIYLTTGEDIENTRRIRTVYLSKGILRITPVNGYKIAVFVYNSSGTYVGEYNGVTIQTSTLYWFESEVNLKGLSPDYNIRLVVSNALGDDSISPSSATNIIFESRTDESLKKPGIAADSKIVGDKIDNLNTLIDNLEPGLSIEARLALLACLKNCAWINEDGIRYYNELKSALGMAENKIYLYKFNDSLISSGNKDFGLTAPSPVYASGKYGKCIVVQAQTPDNAPRAFNISENNLPSLYGDFTISTWFKVGTNGFLNPNTCFRLAVYMNDNSERNSVTELTDLQYYNSYQNQADNFDIRRAFAGIALTYTTLSDQFTPYFSWWNASINKVYLFSLRNDSYKILNNTWTHFAFCRKNNNCTIYIDGRKAVSFKYFGDFYIPNQIVIGCSLTAGTPNGTSVPANVQPNVDELYINDGECIFDGEFTPSEIVL